MQVPGECCIDKKQKELAAIGSGRDGEGVGPAYCGEAEMAEVKLSAAEGDVATTGVEAESAGGVGLDLEGDGPLEVVVGGGTHSEDIVRAYVCDDEIVTRDEPNTIDSGGQALAADLDGNLGDEVGLIFRGDIARVAAGVDQCSENVIAVGKFDSARVAQLGGSGLGLVVDGGGEKLLNVGGLENGGALGHDAERRSENCQSQGCQACKSS